MNKKFYQAEKSVSQEAGKGIIRQILGYDKKLMMVKVDFKLGAIGELHHHFHTQTTYILSGIFDVSIDGENKILKKGDSFFVPSGLQHGAICKKAGSLLDIFSPAREDFLTKK